ncbi:MAG: hypothetical protein IKV25_03155 [Clostridia bacterium]|nr:hypothetical protein [Clostridia bacterium]
MKDLFDRWQQKYSFKAFIKDGIVDIEKYEKPHILFVLRDMNCSVPNDLCENLRTYGSGSKTWCNVGRWTKALLDVEDYPYDMSPQKRIEQMRRVAVMNIKKEGGYARADGKALVSYAKEQKDMIWEQIRRCDPDIIICCGQGMKDAPSNAVILEKEIFEIGAKWNKVPSCSFSRDWYYFYTEINGKQVPVVSFCHPQVTNLCGRRGHEALFKPLYKDLQLIGKKLIKERE